VSRVADDVCDEAHVTARRHVLRLLAAYAEAEELINIGAYARGAQRDCDVAIELMPEIRQFLQQHPTERHEYPQTCRQLLELARLAGERDAALEQAARAAVPPPARATG